jgi:hypothetical protein
VTKRLVPNTVISPCATKGNDYLLFGAWIVDGKQSLRPVREATSAGLVEILDSGNDPGKAHKRGAVYAGSQ